MKHFRPLVFIFGLSVVWRLCRAVSTAPPDETACSDQDGCGVREGQSGCYAHDNRRVSRLGKRRHFWFWNDCTRPLAGGNCTPTSPAGHEGVLLGALLPLNTMDKNFVCSQPAISVTFQVVMAETLLFAVEMMRDKLSMMNPGFRRFVSGVDIRDTCLNPQRSVQETISLADSVEQQGEATDGARPIAGMPCQVPVVVAVGPAFSTQVALSSGVFSSFGIPHVSYWSTSERFRNKTEYPYFFRTVPSDVHQMHAMVDVIAEFDWKYVHLLVSDDGAYGIPALRAFQVAQSKKRFKGFCLDMVEIFDWHKTEQMERIIKEIVFAIAPDMTDGTKYLEPNVIALIATPEYVVPFFQTMDVMASRGDEKFNMALRNRSLVWLASDAWIGLVKHLKAFSGDYPYLGQHSAIGFQFSMPKAFLGEALKFKELLTGHFRRLKVTGDAALRNPWLGRAMEAAHSCSFGPCPGDGRAGGSSTPAVCLPVCDESANFIDLLNIDMDELPIPVASGSLYLAVRAAMTVAWNVFERWQNESMPFPVAGADYLGAALNLTSWSNTSFHLFNEQHEIEPRFRLLNLQPAVNGGRVIREVATWEPCTAGDADCAKLTCLDGSGSNLSACIRWVHGNKPPVSVCALPCGPGQVQGGGPSGMQLEKLGPCCLACVTCSNNTVSNKTKNTCVQCNMYTVPNADHSECEKLELEYLSYSTGPALSIVLLATISLVLAVMTILLYAVRHTSKIVMFSEPKQTYLLLVCICIGYVNAILVFLRPSLWYCSGITVSTASSFILTSSVLMARTLRCVHTSPDKPRLACWLARLSDRFASSFSRQLVLVGTVWVPCLAVHIVWMVVSPLREFVTESNSGKLYLILICTNSSVFMIVSSLLIVLAFLLLAAVAVAGRKAEPSKLTRFNGIAEAKLILFAVFGQAVVWIILTIVFFFTQVVLHAAIIAASLLLHHLVVWGCIFSPRIYSFISGAYRRQKQSSLMKEMARNQAISRHASKSRLLTSTSTPATTPLGPEKSMPPLEKGRSDGILSPSRYSTPLEKSGGDNTIPLANNHNNGTASNHAVTSAKSSRKTVVFETEI